MMDSKSPRIPGGSFTEHEYCSAAFYPAATYTRSAGNDASLIIQPDPEPTYPVPWVAVDPLKLPEDTPLRPVEVTVEEGWTLYLPAGWYHHVMQEEGPGGICVAVN
jgi:jumonji domain-containing protein 7